MRWVERYCVRHPRFGVENLMRYLIIGNAVVWLLTLMDRTGTVRYFSRSIRRWSCAGRSGGW